VKEVSSHAPEQRHIGGEKPYSHRTEKDPLQNRQKKAKESQHQKEPTRAPSQDMAKGMPCFSPRYRMRNQILWVQCHRSDKGGIEFRTGKGNCSSVFISWRTPWIASKMNRDQRL